jgi:hypothetical protein
VRGVKPSPALWKRVNEAMMNENAAVAVITLQSGLAQLLIQAGVCSTEEQARVHLAAMLLSPDNAPHAGSLLPQLQAEIARISGGGWLT